jgi:hypothetical protein
MFKKIPFVLGQGVEEMLQNAYMCALQTFILILVAVCFSKNLPSMEQAIPMS